MNIKKILKYPDFVVDWIVNKLKLKNIDLIIAVFVIGFLSWSWNSFIKEFFAYIINLLFPNSYGILRTRVLSEYFVLLPLVYSLGYFHYIIKQNIKTI